MNFDDRREYPRLRPKDLTFVALRPDFTRLGKIVDISGGGLCFQFMAKGIQPPDGAIVQADIFVSSNGYYLPSVPCKMVYEKKAAQDVTFPIGHEHLACGLQFEGLSKEQLEKLDYYLNEHTAGTA